MRYRTADVGRRGAILLCFGLVSALQGVKVFTLPASAAYQGSYISDILSRQGWGWAWIVSGVLAAVFAFTPKREQGHDTPGFVCAISVPLIWFCAFFAQGIVKTDLNSFLSAVGYVIWVGALLIAVGWPEPVPTPPTEE